MLLRERGGDAVELTVSVSQLKTLYTALFRQLHRGGVEAFEALDEDDMLATLQGYLQQRARQAGVDATDHAAWEAFLGFPAAGSRPPRRSPDPTD